MVMGDPTTFFYQSIYDRNNNAETNIIKYFIKHELGLCIKVESYVEQMFYVWEFSHNTSVTIAINNIKYFLPLNTNTILFDWEADNLNKNIT